MQEVRISIAQLLEKLDQLAEKIADYKAKNKQLYERNSILEEENNKYKSENQELVKRLETLSQSNKVAVTDLDKDNIKADLESYIEELDACIRKLKEF